MMGAWSCGCPKSPFRPPDRPLSSWGPGPPHGGDPSVPSPKSAGWKQGREHRDGDPMGDPMPGGVWVCPVLGAVGGGLPLLPPSPKPWARTGAQRGRGHTPGMGVGCQAENPKASPVRATRAAPGGRSAGAGPCPAAVLCTHSAIRSCTPFPICSAAPGQATPAFPAASALFLLCLRCSFPRSSRCGPAAASPPREQPGRAGCAGGTSAPIPRGAVPSPGPSWQHPQGQHPGVPHCPPRELPWKSQAGFCPGLSLLGNKLVRCGISSVLPNPGSIHCAAAARLLTALIGGNKKQCFLEGKPSVGLSTPASRNTHHGSLITQGLRMPRLTRC